VKPRAQAWAAQHDEVLAALRAIGNPTRGESIRRDRGSKLAHLGIAFPALRARVKQGFSFSALPQTDQLRVWDALWQHSPCGDVLFAAIEHWTPIVRKQVPPGLWTVVRGWASRVDNWCHADALAGLYAHVLHAHFDTVYPQLQAWNAQPGEWLRRISITSLIHYSGKNAVFLPPAAMLPLLAACVDDRRQAVQLALGWVLRELDRDHPAVVSGFLQQYSTSMSAAAVRRALEKRARLGADPAAR
jgi:3-methyladenine DNA glycosylase AlkD